MVITNTAEQPLPVVRAYHDRVISCGRIIMFRKADRVPAMDHRVVYRDLLHIPFSLTDMDVRQISLYLEMLLH